MVLTAGTWIFCLYLFAFPEKPMNYRLLGKVGKLPAIEDFGINNVPEGKFFIARDLYKKFYHFDGRQLDGTNSKLKRNYLLNYEGEDPIFVKGPFRIEQVRQLREADYFQSGWIVQALPYESVTEGSSQAGGRRVFPHAVFEFVFPSAEVPPAGFKVGEELTLDTLKDFASLLHVERVGVDHFCFTALPLLYGNRQMSESDSIALSPPGSVNVEATWPLFEKNVQISNSSTIAVAPKPQ